MAGSSARATSCGPRTATNGARVYPQEALAGQVIGYVGEVTAEDLDTLEAEGYQAGDVVGRSGLESGAEPLLRGTPGWSLVAVPAEGDPTVVLETDMVPGADVAITIRPEIQAVAQEALAGYAPGGHRRRGSAERRRLGARQPAGLQSELDDDRIHPGRNPALSRR